MAEERGKEGSEATGHCFVPVSKNGLPFDPWHSTPIKKENMQTDGSGMARRASQSPQTPSNQVSSLSLMQGSKSPACNLEITTIQKQRMELQLLIAELKNRDQELNTMTAAHHRQLQVWEQDRQRVLTLEQRCVRLEDELQKRNEVIRALSKRLKVMEAREKESHKEFSKTQQQLQELNQRQQHGSEQRHDLEERNQSLNSTIITLSSQVGKLQVHEEELTSMLRLKDKDLMEATNHILALTSRQRESDELVKESQEHKSKMLRETEKYKRHFREARHENVQLKDELQEKTIENNSQREELIRLKQESQLLRKELALAGEGETWKDELLGLARSKQERTESELLCLRQVCEKQQNDLQLLKLNLESTSEALRQCAGHRSFESATENRSSEVADRKEGTQPDLVAVINRGLEPENPSAGGGCQSKRPAVLSFSSSGDVTCLYVECSTPSPRRRSPAFIEDLAFSSTASNKQEERTSSTSRLQRLLAESQQMVDSLERSSGKSLSPALSPTSHCDSVCSLPVNKKNCSDHNHTQPPRNSQGGACLVDDSQILRDQQFLGNKECG